MNIPDLVNSFISMERDLKLYDWEPDNIPVWELIRFPIFLEIESLKVEGTARPREKISKIKLIKSLLKSIMSKNPFKAGQIDYFLLNHPRKKYVDKEYIDIYSDFLFHELSNLSAFESYFSGGTPHFISKASERIFYLDQIQILGRLSQSFSNFIRLSNYDIEKCKEISQSIRINFDVDFTSQYFITYIQKTIIKWKTLLPIAQRLIKKLSPKIGIEVVGHLFINQMFTYLLKKEKIPVIELQHGSVGPYHIGYNSDCQAFKTYPDYFFSWGRIWTDETRLPLAKDKVCEVGFPYMDNMLQTINKCEKNDNEILYISQYREDLLEFAVSSARHLENYQITYKAHPAEYNTIEEKLSAIDLPSNFKLINHDKENLYEIMGRCKYVVGIFSTALLEALNFCDRVIIVKFYGWEAFSSYIKENLLLSVESLEDLFQLIRKNPTLHTGAKQHFFVPNAASNILRKIKEIKN